MGINDIKFKKEENEFLSCSSDRTVKHWKINLEGNTIEQLVEFQLSDEDQEVYKENADK